MPHICRIFRQNAAYFTAFLAGELPADFPKKSRYKPVSLVSHLELVVTHLVVGFVTVVNDDYVTTAAVVSQLACVLHRLRTQHSNRSH